MSASKPKRHLAAMDDVVKGRFQRKPSQFRNWISKEPDARFPPAPDRYRLYVSLACPWAHRTLITRAMKGLEDVLPVTVVHHHMGGNGWRFVTEDEENLPPMCEPEPLYGYKFIKELYFKAEPEYEGRFTVPVLWDSKEGVVVNNESSEIIVMLNSMMNEYAKNPEVDLFPVDMRDDITKMADSFYNEVNNGVYRCGFATTQEAYDEAFFDMFKRLDELDEHLSKNRYLMGDKFTLADIRLFVTLIRFDAVYVVHFKTNQKQIKEYKNLSAFVREIYQMPQIKPTVSFEHIKRHYYGSHPSINPHLIVPHGPDLSHLEEPHGRDNM